MILNVNKPQGVTSRDAVNAVERLMRPEKCGHAGTLDPIATGVLLICLGKSTRLVPYIHELPKTYRATFLHGVTSDSDDTETELRPVDNAPALDATLITSVLPQFIGEIAQVPPQYSAVWVDGRRAYNRVRGGEEVSLAPRNVHVHSIEVLNVNDETFSLEIECGSGTYIRSIGRDIAQSLGTGAVMTELERTAIGPFSVEHSLTIEEQTKDDLLQFATPPLVALPHFPRIHLTGDALTRTHQGQPLTIDQQQFPLPEIEPPPLMGPTVVLSERPDFIAALNERDELVALLERVKDKYWPRQVFQYRRPKK
ncbi:MAG: tRNA pseudouridine(55) synthase TruB [Planctomycetaceae bacterium]|nr:tRNA pseudouridine(55) synthase TruB [Planctomycetaceae bacterium]